MTRSRSTPVLPRRSSPASTGSRSTMRRVARSSTPTSATKCWGRSSGASPASASTRSPRRRIFRPLGMKDTGFLSPAARPEFPPRASRRRSSAKDAGCAARFTTRARSPWAESPATPACFRRRRTCRAFCRMILDGGRLGSARVLSPLSVEALTRPRVLRRRRRPVPRLRHRDRLRPPSRRPLSAGFLRPHGIHRHLGLDRSLLRSFVVFLSNRVHPDGKGDVGRLRALVATIVAAAARRRTCGCRRAVSRGARPGRAGGARGGRRAPRGVFPSDRRKARGSGHERDGPVAGWPVDGRGPDLRGRPEGRGRRSCGSFRPSTGSRSNADARSATRRTPRRAPDRLAVRRAPAPEAGGPRGSGRRRLDIQDVGTRFYTYVTTLGIPPRGSGESEDAARRARPPGSHRRDLHRRASRRLATGFPSRRTLRSPSATASRPGSSRAS